MLTQFIQQRRIESLLRDAQMLKLVRLDQTSRAIVFEDESIAPPHIAACGIFRKIKSIFDQFENDIVARQRENDHHHAGRSFGDDESIRRRFAVGDEIAVELCFTVSMDNRWHCKDRSNVCAA